MSSSTRTAWTGRGRGLLAATSLAVAAAAMAPPAQARSLPGADAPAVAPPQALTLSSSDLFTVSAQVNGQPMRLRVDPGSVGIRLNPAAAERARVKQSLLSNIFSMKVGFGPHEVGFSTGRARVEIGSWRDRLDFYAFERNVIEGADGIIGIGDLPYETVTLQLRPVRTGERSFSLPVQEAGVLGLRLRYPAAGNELFIRFSLLSEKSHASAAAGAVLAQEHGGAWSGEPIQTLIMFDVQRPVRPMRLSRPMSLNGLPVERIFVRTSDYRGRHLLPTDPPEDPNEVVVTGNREKSKPHFLLTVGWDRLQSCSAISYHKSTRQLALTCLSG